MSNILKTGVGFFVFVPGSVSPIGPVRSRKQAEACIKNAERDAARKANPKGKVKTVPLEPRWTPVEWPADKRGKPKDVTNAERKHKAKLARKANKKATRHRRAIEMKAIAAKDKPDE